MNNDQIGILIEPADIKDLRYLLELEKLCFSKSEMWSLLDYIGVLSLNSIIKRKAMAGEQMVGFVAMDEKLHSSLAQLMTLAVHPNFRQKGIATALLKEAENLLHKSTRIELVARVDNQAAIQLYQKFGYQEEDIISNYYRDGVAGQRMLKILNSKQI